MTEGVLQISHGVVCGNSIAAKATINVFSTKAVFNEHAESKIQKGYIGSQNIGMTE
jgi:hypothetical protein